MGKIIAIIFAFLLFIPGKAFANPLKILFYYPGAQGNQEAAQPILDSFSENLKKVSEGKIEAQVFYIADAKEGLNFIKAQKPQAAIVSLDTFYQNASSWGATVIAKTLQIPSADGTNQYFLIGKTGQALPGEGTLQVLFPQILDPQFVTKKLFPDLKPVLEVQNTSNPIGELRAIGQGTKQGLMLLDQFEYANISKLKTPWAANLSVLAKSHKVSSAPFIVFSGNISPEVTTNLQNALLKMSEDSAAQESLLNLRLKGFKKATSVD